MSRNLVIVESPAKARTIERYLGPGHQVLASYGHVRDLPENPGKGQLGVDVDHDFEPTYEVTADRRRQRERDREGGPRRRPRLPGHGPRPRGRGDRLARRRGCGHPRSASARGSPSRRSRSRPSGRRSPTRASIDRDLVDAQQARRIVDRLVGYTLSPLSGAQGPLRPVGGARPVGRGAARRRARARDPGVHGPRVLDDRGPPRVRRRVDVHGGAGPGRRQEAARSPTARPPASTPTALRASHPVVDAVTVKSSKRSPAPPFTTSTLQQEASRRLGFSPKRTMSVAQRLYEGVETPEGQVGLITYMRTDSVALAGAGDRARRATSSTDRYGAPYALAQAAATTRPRPATPRRPTRRSGRRRSRRDPEELGRHLGRDEARLYRLIWQRALASQMAEKVLETTTADLVDGRYRASAPRRPGPSSTASAASTPRAATTGEDEAERSLPPLRARATGRPCATSTPTQHFTEPPPRFTEAMLIKALEEHGIGRPSTYAATITTIVDRGYVVVKERRLHPEPVGRDRHRPPGRALRRLRRPRVHGPHGGGARRGRPRRARLGAAGPRVLRSAADAGRREASRAAPARPDHGADRRGLLPRPSDGHPPRPQRAVPRLLPVPGAQGVASAARRGVGHARASRRRRDVPGLRRDRRRDAGRQARQVRCRSSAATVTRNAHTSGGTARRRRSSSRSRSPARCATRVT